MHWPVFNFNRQAKAQRLVDLNQRRQSGIFSRKYLGLCCAVVVLMGFSPVVRGTPCVETFVRSTADAPAMLPPDPLISNAHKDLTSRGFQPLEGAGPPEGWRLDGVIGIAIGYRLKLHRAIDLVARHAQTVKEIFRYGEPRDAYFQSLVDAALSARGESHLLDLYGSGYLAYELQNVTSTTGIRRGPNDLLWNAEVMPKGWQPFARHREIYGDLFNPQTWEMLDRHMRDHQIDGFDLVTIKPEGAWSLLTENQQIAAIRYLLANSAARMSPHGHLYFSTYLRAKGLARPWVAFQLARFARQIEHHYGLKMVWKLSPNGNFDVAIVPR